MCAFALFRAIYYYFVTVISWNCLITKCEGNEFDFGSPKVWGPGFEDALDFGPFHVKYFYVQFEGADFCDFKVKIDGKSFQDENIPCRIRNQIIDRQNRSYIVRFMAYTPCGDVKLTLYCGVNVVKNGVYNLKGTLLPHECNCPVSEINLNKKLDCPDSYSQIETDLKPWKNSGIDFDKALKEAEQTWGVHEGAYSFCHYRIVQNEIFRKCYGKHVGFNMFSDALLKYLARIVILPDTEFLMNLGDWPLQKKLDKFGNSDYLIPVISWCGSEETSDILFPTYEVTEATLEMMGRVYLDIMSVQEMRSPIWKEKIDKAFFRGRDSRQERLDLVMMSRDYPNEIKADITRFFFFRDQIEKYGPESKNVPFKEFFKYRYQLNVDGTVAAYRFPFLLGGDSLILKQDSPYYEHFYGMLQPYVHFVPVRRDLTDVREKVLWARTHENEVQKIIQNAQEFVQNHLMPENILCYHVAVIQAYTALLKKIERKPKAGMEHVPQKRPEFCPPCLKSGNLKEKSGKIEL